MLFWMAALCTPRAEGSDTRPLATMATIGAIDDESLESATAQLDRKPAVAYLLIDSPGGSVFAGFRFIDAMREAQAAGTRIVCTVKDKGMAASMAAVILSVCDERYMGKQSALMFHTASLYETSGNQWELERTAKMIESLNARLAITIVGRMKLSMAEYMAKVRDNDWWVGWEEALAVGAIDGVAL